MIHQKGTEKKTKTFIRHFRLKRMVLSFFCSFFCLFLVYILIYSDAFYAYKNAVWNAFLLSMIYTLLIKTKTLDLYYPENRNEYLENIKEVIRRNGYQEKKNNNKAYDVFLPLDVWSRYANIFKTKLFLFYGEYGLMLMGDQRSIEKLHIAVLEDELKDDKAFLKKRNS